MGERKSFYVTLPSNACHDIYPENNNSDFTISLSQPIELIGEYEVALAEISYTNSTYNIYSLEDSYDVLDKDQPSLPPIYQKIKTGKYDSVEKLVDAMNDGFTTTGLDIQLVYSDVKKRVCFDGSERYSLKHILSIC